MQNYFATLNVFCMLNCFVKHNVFCEHLNFSDYSYFRFFNEIKKAYLLGTKTHKHKFHKLDGQTIIKQV